MLANLRAPEVGLPLLGGRVALRENRAPTHRFTAPRRREGARPKINLLKSSRTRGPGGAPLHYVPGARPARAGCRAVRDSTLVAWYRSIYAPRTGGAHDSHHRTAGIAGRTRRRGGGVAARGKRVAARAHAAGRRTDWPSYGWLDLRNRLKGSQPGRLSYVQIRRAPRCLSRQCVSWALNLSLIPRWRSRQKLVRLEIESRDSTLRRRSIRPGPFRWQRED